MEMLLCIGIDLALQMWGTLTALIRLNPGRDVAVFIHYSGCPDVGHIKFSNLAYCVGDAGCVSALIWLSRCEPY